MDTFCTGTNLKIFILLLPKQWHSFWQLPFILKFDACFDFSLLPIEDYNKSVFHFSSRLAECPIWSL